MKQFCVRVALAAGSVAAVGLTSSPAPQLLFHGARNVLSLMTVLHFQVNMPSPEPKISLGSVTVRMDIGVRKP